MALATERATRMLCRYSGVRAPPLSSPRWRSGYVLSPVEARVTVRMHDHAPGTFASNGIASPSVASPECARGLRHPVMAEAKVFDDGHNEREHRPRARLAFPGALAEAA